MPTPSHLDDSFFGKQISAPHQQAIGVLPILLIEASLPIKRYQLEVINTILVGISFNSFEESPRCSMVPFHIASLMICVRRKHIFVTIKQKPRRVGRGLLVSRCFKLDTLL